MKIYQNEYENFITRVKKNTKNYFLFKFIQKIIQKINKNDKTEKKSKTTDDIKFFSVFS